MKKLTTILIAIFVFFNVSCVFAAEEDKAIRIFFDGEEISFREQPQFKEGRLVVPVRSFLKALGSQLEWNKEEGSVTTYFEDKTIVFHVEHSLIEINGDKIELETSMEIVGGSMIMPLRTISELLDLQVSWDGEKGVVKVESDNYVPLERVKDSTDLPLAVTQWVDTLKHENINTTLELDDHLYILSALGWKPSGGYDVKIRRILRENSSWSVNVVLREPQLEHSTIQVIDYPYDLVCLDLADAGRPSAVVFRTVNH